MEHLDFQKYNSLSKAEKYAETSKLYLYCEDWALTHYWEMMLEEELTESQAEKYKIAKVLWEFLKGRDPFEQFKKTHHGDSAHMFKVRVAAVILTNNKKKASELFCLPDDGKTLNTFIAARAREFFTQDYLKGLTVAKKANRVVDVISQNCELRKEYCERFADHFSDILVEKKKQDCTYHDYSFRGWIKMARSKKG